nr:uncharacterized protein LOC115255772 [Aedes albopictus]
MRGQQFFARRDSLYAAQKVHDMRSFARNFVYWPNIYDQIIALVRSCQECASIAKTDTKTKLESWPIPEKPWQRVHADFAGPINDTYFLLVVDSYSKWPEIIPTKRITTAATISSLRKIFGRFEMPEVLVTDNRTQLTSDAFEEFLRSCQECASIAKTDTKTKLESWPIPEKPWQRVHADFAGPINDTYFLLVVDSYSKWPEIIPTKRITTAATISSLRKIFGRFEMPEVLVTDNRTQLTSDAFEARRFRWTHQRYVLPASGGLVFEVAGNHSDQTHYHRCDNFQSSKNLWEIRNAGSSGDRQ